MPNSIMQDKYILGQSDSRVVASVDNDIKLDLSLKINDEEINDGAIEGVVTDNSNNPVIGALVKLMSEQYEPITNLITDENGRYYFPNIKANLAYRLYSVADNKQLSHSGVLYIYPYETLNINFTLTDKPTSNLLVIAGDVADSADNIAISNVRVALYTIDLKFNESLTAILYTNDYGQFIFRDISIGSYKIIATNDNYKTYTSVLNVLGNINPLSVQIKLEKIIDNVKGTISGIIQDTDGSMIPFANVILFKVEADNSLSPVMSTNANSEGFYIFYNIPIGTYVVKSDAITITDTDIEFKPIVQKSMSPNFYSFNITDIFSYLPLNISSVTGSLYNGASFGNNSFIVNLGGNNNGAVEVQNNFSVRGNYLIGVQYLAGDGSRNMKIDVNGVNDGINYAYSKTNSWNSQDSNIFYFQANFNNGLNKIKFYNDTGVSSPSIANLNFILETKFIDFQGVKGDLYSGASLVLNNTFVGNIGDNGGYLTIPILVAISGMYDLSIQYLSGDIDRYLKIDVNAYTVGSQYLLNKTNSWNVIDAKNFTIYKIFLDEGKNTIKLYNYPNAAAPWIGNLRFSLSSLREEYQVKSSHFILSNATYYTKNFSLNGNYIELKEFMIAGIGGNNNGNVKFNIVCSIGGNYNIKFKTLTTDLGGATLKLSINNEITTYLIPSVNIASSNLGDATNFLINAKLNKGNNSINFYNDTGAEAPYLGKIILTYIEPIKIYTSAISAKTFNSADLTWDGTFMGFIGGINNGFITLNLDIPIGGEYTVDILYLSSEASDQYLYIDVNSRYAGEFYLKMTNTNNTQDAKTLSVTLTFNTGNNVIKFYNTTGQNSVNLGNIILTKKKYYSKYLQAKDVDLMNGAKISNDNSTINGVGKGLGFISLNIDIPVSDSYNLVLKYLAQDNSKYSNISVNWVLDGNIYTFEQTTSMNIDDCKNKSINVNLNAGINNIQIFNN